MALPLMRIADPQRRVRGLAVRYRTSLAELSEMLGRPRHYLSRFCRLGIPDALNDREVDLLSRFFGVPAIEVGGADPRWAKWHNHAERLSDRKLGRGA